MASQVYGKFHAELTGGNFHLSVNGYTFEKFDVRISLFTQFPVPDLAGIYLPKVNNRNTRPRCEICSKLTIKTPD